jgi:hypothetical protein
VVRRRARSNHQIRFISPQEILERAPEETQASPRPYQWRITVSRPGKPTMRETVRPDYIFGLEFQSTRDGRARVGVL